MAAALHPPTRNRVLAQLPQSEARQLEPALERVALRSGEHLQEPGARVSHLYFPLRGIVSLRSPHTNGALVEMAQVGREGMVGLPALLGDIPPLMRAAIQADGEAWRLAAARAREAFAGCPSFRFHVLGYAHELIQQIARTALCNRFCTVEQHLCRWLLACLERLDGAEVLATHETIAATLGVRRQGVTEAARRLEQHGIILSARGRIVVLDRPALEESACTCYGMSRRRREFLQAWAPNTPTSGRWSGPA